MKKVGEIMKDMGFNAESPEGTQKAFIKYLIRVANKNKHIPEPVFFDEEQKTEESWQELKIHSKGYKPVLDNIEKPFQNVSEHKQEQLCFPFVENKPQSEAG